MAGRSRQVALGVIVAAVVVVSIGWVIVTRGGEPALARTTAVTSGSGAAPIAPAAAPADGSAKPASTSKVRRIDPAARDRLLADIRAKAAKRTGPPADSAGAGTTPRPTLPAGELAKDYIRASVRDLIPLLAECYEEGLERDEQLAGQITVLFTIEGEPEVGGVVGESSIEDEQTTIADPQVRECVQETMHGLEIDPPEAGGVVTVRYPFVFEPAPE